MLRVSSKYKIAKRLGNAVFEQTQTQKFALSEARSQKSKPRGRGGSDYGRQLLEKQRIRYTYGINERQLSNYAKAAKEEADPSGALHRMLEMRADTVVYRLGFAKTRRAARQMVSHGHVTVNGRRITTPSHRLVIGDVLAVREGSRTSTLFGHLQNPEETISTPSWLEPDFAAYKGTVKGEPEYRPGETVLDYGTLFEFYSR